MKPKTLGLIAALVAVPTVAAVVPGPLAGALASRTAHTWTAARTANTWTPARTATPPRPAAKGGTATLVSVIVTTGLDSASSASTDALREPGRRLRSAACNTPGAGTNAYSLSGSRVTGSTTAHFNPAGAPVSGAATAFQNAFSAWKAASNNAPSITVASDGTVRSATADHTDELMFAALQGRTLAVTYTWHWTTGEYEDDVVFNTKVPWFMAGSEGTGCYPGVNAYDLQDVATHEFGHVYGLGHVQAPFNTMYPTATTGETYKRSLAPGDALGIRAVYGG